MVGADGQDTSNRVSSAGRRVCSEGHGYREAARHFRVSPKFVNDLIKLRREAGSLEPRHQGNGRDRARLRFVGALMLGHHPVRTRADLWRVAICHFAFCHNCESACKIDPLGWVMSESN